VIKAICISQVHNEVQTDIKKTNKQTNNQ